MLRLSTFRLETRKTFHQFMRLMKPNRPKQDGEFCRRLNSLVREMNWTGTDVSMFASVSTKTAYSWMRGERVPPKRNEITTQEDVMERLELYRETILRGNAAREAAEKGTALAAVSAAIDGKTAPMPADAAPAPAAPQTAPVPAEGQGEGF